MIWISGGALQEGIPVEKTGHVSRPVHEMLRKPHLNQPVLKGETILGYDNTSGSEAGFGKILNVFH